MSDRRKAAARRTDRRKQPPNDAEQLVKKLRMQARTRASSNAVMRVEPSRPELFLEWKAADAIEQLDLIRRNS